jgi:hypothetical protein
MTRLLSLVICACALAVPMCSPAGNMAPRLWLEVYYQADDPTDPEGPGYLADPCRHPLSAPPAMPCYAPRLPYNFYVIPIHVGNLDAPICATVGSGCAAYGGIVGVGFGAALTGGTGLTFMSWNACPGFIKGPSVSGEPSSMLASSTELCRDWFEHEGYMLWINDTGTSARFINIVASADLGHYRVINCSNTYDDGTTVGGGVQIGGTQVNCGGWGPVEEMNWGAIKALYR